MRVPAGMTARYSLAVSVLSLRRSRAVWFSALGVLGGAVWWALVGMARHQDTWWFGFVLAVVVLVALPLVFAAAVFGREAKSPTFPKGKTIASQVSGDMITFDYPSGPLRVRPSDIRGISRALGFIMLTITSRDFVMVVPAQLLPAEYSG